MTDANNTPPWEQIARYLAGEATPNDQFIVDKWLAMNEANHKTFRQIERLWSAPDSSLPESDPSKVWEQRIAPQLDPTDTPIIRPLHQKSWWAHTARYWRVAASVVGIALTLFALYRSYQTSQPSAQVASNPLGKRSLIVLDDGTRVWLNADSRLAYPPNFTGPIREVSLVGEAFFDVAHNPKQPFVIRLATASIRVLGTSFNVRAYPGDATVKTTVLTGRVAFIPNISSKKASAADTLFITPNHHVVQQVRTLSVTEEPVQAQKEAAWKDNRLVFDQTPMSEVAQTLERWYGLSVTLENPELANCPLTATFEGQSLQEVMDLISRTGRFNYTLGKQQLTIKGQGCQD